MNYFEVDSHQNKYYVVPEALMSSSIKDDFKKQKINYPFYKKTWEDSSKMVYMKEEDYIKYSQIIIGEVTDKNSVSLSAITMAIESSYLLLEKNGFNKDSFNMINSLTEQFLKINYNKQLKNQFQFIVASPRSKEFVMKTILCKALAVKIGWKSDMILKKLFIASFFCDLGELIPNEEGDPYDNHQKKSIAFLEKYGKLSEDVRQAILHHHEYNDGSGPYGLVKHSIHPMARIIRVVDELIGFISRKDKEFVQKIKEMSIQKLDSQIVTMLLTMLNH